MQSHFLLVGSRKKSYTESALQAGAKISLLISADQYKDEYQSLFHRVLKVADIYDWQQVKEVIDQSERI